MRTCRASLLLFLAFLLLGCFGGGDQPPPGVAVPVAAVPPPAPPPIPRTKVELRVEAAGDVNPSLHGTGAPVVLRIYELKGMASFNGADFFALYDKDQASLGGDLARKRELLLRPGEKQTLVLEPEEGSGFFAALAAFRSLDSARWRVSAQIPPHQTSVFDLKLGGTQMTLTAVPVQQSPPPAPLKPASAPGAPVPTVPSVSVPPVTMPSVSVPTAPNVAVPNAPPVSAPTVPSVTTPPITLPASGAMPSVTIPPVTVPITAP